MSGREESRRWAQDALEALGNVEGHKHLRLQLMQRALKKAETSTMFYGSIPVEYYEEGATPLFDAAWAGDQDSCAALCLLASQMLASGQQLPPRLLFHVYSVLLEIGLQNPSRGRGRHDPHENVTRDRVIIGEIQRVCKETGLHPTRGDATKNKNEEKECGCSIVAKRHGMTERAVEEVWGKRGQYGIK